MFERFTDKARSIVTLASDEARRLGHDYIGTEHLLIALTQRPDTVGAKALIRAGAALDEVRSAAERIAGHGSGTKHKHIPFTPRAKKVLELSLREALALGHNYIGTEHIVLALLREGADPATSVGEGLAASVLARHGVTYPVAKIHVEALLTEAGVERGLAQAAGGARAVAARRQRRSRSAAGPRCPSCEAALSESARYSIVEVSEHDGDGTTRALFLFCGSCGATLDTVTLPDDA